MKGYASFCPVAKTAEIFAERWTPLLLRELCFGARRFSELQQGVPLISRSLLAERLRELERAGVIETVPGPGRRHEYRLTEAGEAFRPIIAAMAQWGTTFGRGWITAEDTDPMQLVWSMRRHLDANAMPDRRFVIRIELHGLGRGQRAMRYWWLLIRKPDSEVCLKHPGFEIDVAITAHLYTLTQVFLGYMGVNEARRDGKLAITGKRDDVATTCALLGLRGEAWSRVFDHSARPDAFGPVPTAGRS